MILLKSWALNIDLAIRKLACSDWLFLARHTQLSVRKPESTSMSKARGFNRPHTYPPSLCTCNSAGQFLPPMLVFPRKRMVESLMNGLLLLIQLPEAA